MNRLRRVFRWLIEFDRRRRVRSGPRPTRVETSDDYRAQIEAEKLRPKIVGG